MASSTTRTTWLRLFPRNRGLLWDQWEARRARRVAWSERCEHDVIFADDSMIWIIDAIDEWLATTFSADENV